jgi:hypothetical protein
VTIRALSPAVPAHIKYVVKVPHVREVSLYGNADLAFWRERLAPEGLAPRDENGRAELLLIAAHMRWMGVWFSELSISIALESEAPAKMFLIHAFNSIPWFAWVERVLFQTPYYPGQTRLETRAPLALEVEGQLSARMTAAREPAWSGAESWEGGILLPRELSRTAKAEKLFYARLSGQTEIYPFTPNDTLQWAAASPSPIIQALRDSHFTGKEWHVRADATHAKSQTY